MMKWLAAGGTPTWWGSSNSYSETDCRKPTTPCCTTGNNSNCWASRCPASKPRRHSCLIALGEMPTMRPAAALSVLEQQVVACSECPRLIAHCRAVAAAKRRAYMDWDYWGQPVPSFGDPDAELLLIGLAPGAHGANRTGRMFTGDRSGDFLFNVLYQTGFASQPSSSSRDDGLTLRNAYVTAAARCAPPENKLTPEEMRNCRPYLLG